MKKFILPLIITASFTGYHLFWSNKSSKRINELQVQIETCSSEIESLEGKIIEVIEARVLAEEFARDMMEQRDSVKSLCGKLD